MEILHVNKMQDGDGHWYWIPQDDLNEFNRYMEEMDGKEYMDCPEVFDSFSEYFEMFRTWGDPDIQPDYFKRDNITIVRFE